VVQSGTVSLTDHQGLIRLTGRARSAMHEGRSHRDGIEMLGPGFETPIDARLFHRIESANLLLAKTGGTGMRYLNLVILVLANALISPAFAQTCCPAGCAQEANRCVTTGPLWTRCTPIACAEGSRPSGGSSGRTGAYRASVLARPLRTARTYVAPRQIPPQCELLNPTKAQVDEATDQCVNALTGSAQWRGCFFEDDAGRAEDKRTGLSCPDRQAALAKQCLKRCADYASDTSHLGCAGSYPNTVWHISFGDISGDTGDSARVDLCGPRLRASVSSRLRQPPTR
jgi:hypothetical protein